MCDLLPLLLVSKCCPCANMNDLLRLPWATGRISWHCTSKPRQRQYLYILALAHHFTTTRTFSTGAPLPDQSNRNKSYVLAVLTLSGVRGIENMQHGKPGLITPTYLRRRFQHNTSSILAVYRLASALASSNSCHVRHSARGSAQGRDCLRQPKCMDFGFETTDSTLCHVCSQPCLPDVALVLTFPLFPSAWDDVRFVF